MCGIAGFNWSDEGLGEKMGATIAYRGPDASGIYASEGITLVHKRLAIIDLSPEANQPMASSDGKYQIVFNGEIYNYKDLKKELSSDYQFKTSSDTEVILAGYKKWGSEVVKKMNGIFALAIWDEGNKTLFCARDHMGIKPFYYFWDGQKFIFASELKAIFTHAIERKLNLEAFNDFLRVLYVPEPDTMVVGISKLPLGSYLTLKANKLQVTKYFTPELKIKSWSHKDALRAIHDSIHKAVERQLVADVPVGVYLSGGFDSSAVLAAVSKINPKVKTFSVGFALEEGEDPEKFNRDFELARETAKFFGAEHHPLEIDIKTVAQNLEATISAIDDPISNPTGIVMSELAKFAKKEVTVVLSGNGGDELFGGYERYRMGRRVDALGAIPGAKYFFPKRIREALDMSALDRLAQFEFEKDKRLSKVVSPKYFKPMPVVKEDFKKYIVNSGDKTQDLMMADLKSWLPDQALALGDRMSMQGSLEERVPLLDREVMDLALTLPLHYKVTPFETKKTFKEAFRGELPEQLFKEPKRGWFSPGAKWLRRPEIEKIVRKVFSTDYYAPTQALFDWQAVNQMLDGHISKKEYNLTVLWAILTFQIWAKSYEIKL